jgi:drug/metabolite transporter (DMT)-like permease
MTQSRLVPLSIHQLLRATTPAITAILLHVFDEGTQTAAACASLGLICVGVALATLPNAHDQSRFGFAHEHVATTYGIILTLLGAVLASMKSIATSALQRPTLKSTIRPGLGFSSGKLLHCISPLVFLQTVLYAWMGGEFDRLVSLSFSSAPSASKSEGYHRLIDGAPTLALLLILNSSTALALNFASFEANRRAGALGITITGNLKQVLIIGLECIMVGERWSSVRYLGVLGTVTGSCWFAFEKHREIEEARRDTRANCASEKIANLV